MIQYGVRPFAWWTAPSLMSSLLTADQVSSCHPAIASSICSFPHPASVVAGCGINCNHEGNGPIILIVLLVDFLTLYIFNAQPPH